MFAVPGWAVDSTTVVQENPSTKYHAPASTGTPLSVSRKRKRASAPGNQASNVSGSELERLWDQQATAKPRKAGYKHREDHNDAKGEPPNGSNQRPDQGKPVKSRADTTAPAGTGRKHKESKVRVGDKSQQPSQDGPYPRPKNEDGERRRYNDETESRPFPRDKTLQTLPKPPPLPAKLTPLQAKMRSKLTSARFRHLNETLYTTSSAAAMDLFANSPDLFAEYHAGFSQQVKDSWPVNPVDDYVAAIKSRGAIQPPSTAKGSKSDLPLPRRPKTSLCTVADLGCGDAPLARGCQSTIKSLSLRFHNFDLHAPNSLVQRADISNLPLRDGEVDIAVFCLSLMGTNWTSFVEEAWRVLRGDGKGECWVSEVKSRFGWLAKRPKGEAVENSVGKKRKSPKGRVDKEKDDAAVGEELFVDTSNTGGVVSPETDISAFVGVFARRGFQLREHSVDKSNKMFVSMVFTKSGVPTAGKYRGWKWSGREYQKLDEGKLQLKHTSGAAGGDEMKADDEAKVLKPCLYKTR